MRPASFALKFNPVKSLWGRPIEAESPPPREIEVLETFGSERHAHPKEFALVFEWKEAKGPHLAVEKPLFHERVSDDAHMFAQKVSIVPTGPAFSSDIRFVKGCLGQL